MKSKKLNAAILVGFPCSHRKFILRYKSRVSSLQIFDIIIIFWYPLSRLPTKVLPLGYILNTFIVHLFRSLYSLIVKKRFNRRYSMISLWKVPRKSSPQLRQQSTKRRLKRLRSRTLYMNIPSITFCHQPRGH